LCSAASAFQRNKKNKQLGLIFFGNDKKQMTFFKKKNTITWIKINLWKYGSRHKNRDKTNRLESASDSLIEM
jgi:hypothetical protein